MTSNIVQVVERTFRHIPDEGVCLGGVPDLSTYIVGRILERFEKSSSEDVKSVRVIVDHVANGWLRTRVGESCTLLGSMCDCSTHNWKEEFLTLHNPEQVSLEGYLNSVLT